jgi:probable F420-dependent oxidoreductase
MLPLSGRGLAQHREIVGRLEAAGYDDLWFGEVNEFDAVTPLALAATWTQRIGLGTAVLPVFTRGPAVLAATAATLATVAPGRFTLGLGASSPAIVEGWNGVSFDRPLARTRDVVRFVKAALAGERVDQDFETFSIRGFRLASPPDAAPPVLVAGLRPAMLHVARDEADGAIVNWCGASDLPRIVEEAGPARDLVVRLFVCPSTDADKVRDIARRQITAYLTVPAYAAFQRWVGRGAALERMWEAWDAGDRQGALAAVDDEVVDELVVHGSPAACAAHLARFVESGATALALTTLDGIGDSLDGLLALAPELKALDNPSISLYD